MDIFEDNYFDILTENDKYYFRLLIKRYNEYEYYLDEINKHLNAIQPNITGKILIVKHVGSYMFSVLICVNKSNKFWTYKRVTANEIFRHIRRTGAFKICHTQSKDLILVAKNIILERSRLIEYFMKLKMSLKRIVHHPSKTGQTEIRM